MKTDLSLYKALLSNDGFALLPDIYDAAEIHTILTCIQSADHSSEAFRKSNDVFAIRRFLNEIPETVSLIFNQNLKSVIAQIFGIDYFVIKSIYFDKPESSNWFVPYHQDLTIAVDKKAELPGFGPWTVKQNQTAVQAPVELLQNIYTIRIHLDDTDENNGALKVIPKSHLKHIYRPETIDWNVEKETVCRVQSGGIMLMKPLLLHSSGRTNNNRKRRVIHIEFSNMALPEDIEWAEKLEFAAV